MSYIHNMQLFIQIQYKFVKKNKKLSFDNYALNFDHVALFSRI